MSKGLVIVESPAKARTIGRILGSSFAVRSSMGHIRDLPEKTFGVDIDKRKAIEDLVEQVKELDDR